MTSLISNDLLRSSDKQHLMLLYDDEAERSSAEIACINQALSSGQYCIYATVDANEKDFASKLALQIDDYNKHIEEGNFKLVDFMPFYDSATNGQLTPFKQLKADVESALKKRVASGKSGKALLVADAACNLARHKQFDECVTLEGWWQDTYNEWMEKNLDITIICAHPSSVLKQQSLINEKSRISHVHSLTLDLNDFGGRKAIPARGDAGLLRILVIEPDSDTRILYEKYLKSLPVELVALERGSQALEQTAKLNKHDDEGYDLVIIDTHTRDTNGLELAKKLLVENENQNIIITSTWDIETIRTGLRSYSLDADRYPVLHKPFRFSQLLELIKPARIRSNS